MEAFVSPTIQKTQPLPLANKLTTYYQSNYPSPIEHTPSSPTLTQPTQTLSQCQESPETASRPPSQNKKQKEDLKEDSLQKKSALLSPIKIYSEEELRKKKSRKK